MWHFYWIEFYRIVSKKEQQRWSNKVKYGDFNIL